MSTIKGETWLPCPVHGCEDGMVHVAFKVWPGEEEVRYPNDKAHPGAPAQAEIVEVLDRADCDPHGELTDREIDRMEVQGQDELIEAGANAERAAREAYAERRMEMRRERRGDYY